MNDSGKLLGSVEVTDEQILRAIRQRMAAVEPMVPPAPAWRGGEPVSRRLRPVVRSGVRLAIAPFVLVAVVVALVLAGGMVSGPVAVSTPAADYLEQTYRLLSPTGASISPDQLDMAAQLLTSQGKLSGLPLSSVAKVGTDELLVRIPGNFAGTRVAVGTSHELRFVLLPPETYGTANTPGAVAIPAKGSIIDPTLPAQFTGADLDPNGIEPAMDATNGGNVWLVDFAFRPEKAREFETWTGQHVNEYFAIVLDNVVLNVPYIDSAVTGGKGEISGTFTQAEATELAVSARFAALGLTFELVDEHQYLAPGSTVQPGVTAPPLPAMTPARSGQPTQAASFPMTSLPAPAFTLGSGPVKISVWLDFKCSACRDFERRVLSRVIADYVDTGKATLSIYDDDVIDQRTAGAHESLDAANAARCAADQGKYREYADLLFANQGVEGDGSLTGDSLIALAAQLPIDQAKFATCVRAGTHNAEINASTAAAAAVGVFGVPAVGIAASTQSQLLLGDLVPDYAAMSAAVEAALATTAPTEPGPTPVRTTPASVPTAAVSAAASALPSAAASTAGS